MMAFIIVQPKIQGAENITFKEDFMFQVRSKE